jgi:hypothetical protein
MANTRANPFPQSFNYVQLYPWLYCTNKQFPLFVQQNLIKQHKAIKWHNLLTLTE